ncbi:MFS transporter [Penicillium angulare]|uniref:MFS transporter n=1 Tax=Penicillium angulare TaxID=116970 RepID=UPI0025418755|nr:MFS transporter [Penicillium angulare]KAJ5280927.1 MFS transporter [Penicillium angulare]
MSHGHIDEEEKGKLEEKFIESVALPGFSDEDADILFRYEGTKGKEVIRKIDFHLLPVLAFLYLCSHVDRNNMGNAKIEGMNDDLGLVGNQYNIASTLFFVPYIIFEIPSNIVLKKTRPSLWLSLQVVAWGIVMACMGAVKGFASLTVCRVFLGICEAGFFPGAVYLVTQWYPPHEIQQRLALLYTASAISGAFSGLLAYGIANMGGLQNIAGWRWIFILEGLVPVAFGLALPFLLPDGPGKVKWLTPEEQRFIDLRFRQAGARSAEGEGDQFSWSMLLGTMLDWKILLAVVLAMVNAAPNAAFSYTMPTIINKLGFEASKAQLLTIPPYFCGAVSSWLSGRLADRFSWRFPFIVAPMIVMLISFIMLFVLSANIEQYKAPMYFAIILAQIGIYPLLPGISAWTGNNLPQSWKRSIGIAWLLAAGNTGSFIGTNVFLEWQAPHYTIGYGVSIGIIVLGIVTCCILEFFLWRLNKVKRSIPESQTREQFTPDKLVAMGEKSPLYIYTL